MATAKVKAKMSSESGDPAGVRQPSRSDHRFEICRRARASMRRPLPAARVSEFEPHAGEQQPLHAEQLREQAIVPALAVRRVADDRVRNVREVATQLVAAAGVGLQFHQRVTRCRIAVDAVRQLDGLEPAKRRA